MPFKQKQGLPVDKASGPRERSHATGKTYCAASTIWRRPLSSRSSCIASSRRTPRRLLSGSRRDFLKIMGASVASPARDHARLPSSRSQNHRVQPQARRDHPRQAAVLRDLASAPERQG